jgi:hypothetical protein
MSNRYPGCSIDASPSSSVVVIVRDPPDVLAPVPPVAVPDVTRLDVAVSVSPEAAAAIDAMPAINDSVSVRVWPETLASVWFSPAMIDEVTVIVAPDAFPAAVLVALAQKCW